MRIRFEPRRAAHPRVLTGACLAAAAGIWAGAAAAQDDPGGMRLILDIDNRVEVDSNSELLIDSPGTSVIGSTRLGFGLVSETRRQSLSFGGAITARAFDIPTRDDSTDLGDRELAFEYQREASRAALNVRARYDRTDIERIALDDLLDDDEFDLGDPDLDDLRGRGSREIIGFGAGVEIGIDMPVRLSLDADYTERNFDETVDRTDSWRFDFGAELGLRLSSVTEGTVGLDASRFARDDDAETQRDRVVLLFGVTHEFSETLSGNAAIGPAWVRTREDGETEREIGVNADLGLDYERPTGTIGFDATARTDEDGIRTAASIGRGFELPRGEIGGAIGLTRAADGDIDATAAFEFRRDMPRGTFNARLARDVTPRFDDTNVLRTVARVDYDYAINNISGIGLTAAFARNEETDGADRLDRIDIGATYNREITEDWAMELGYRYRARNDDAGDRESHAVFFGINRNFNFGI